MKIQLFLIAIGISSCGNAQTESIKDSSKVNTLSAWSVNGKPSSKEVALGVIEFLRNSDTSQYLKLVIPLEVQKLILERDFEARTNFKEYHEAQLDSLEARYSSALENFLVRSGYIHEIMVEDKAFLISKASIDTILVEQLPANMFRGENFPKENWNMVTVIMEYKKEKFYFEIPQIVELEGKWFLYYPEYYLRDQKELDFVNSLRNKKD